MPGEVSTLPSEFSVQNAPTDNHNDVAVADPNELFAKTRKPVVVVDENRALATPPNQVVEPFQNQQLGDEPSQAIGGELVADENQILADLNIMFDNPGVYTRKDAQQIVADAYAGRNFQQLQQENPQLAEALTRLENKAQQTAQKYSLLMSQSLENQGVLSAEQNVDTQSLMPLSPETVTDLERISPDELQMTVTKSDGEKVRVSTTTLLLGAAIIAADLAFFKGANTFPMLRSVLGPSLQGVTREFLGRLGVDIPENYFDRHEVYDMVVENMNPKDLLHLFEEFPKRGNEMYDFLAGMSEEERHKLLAGESFGGLLKRHKFTSEEIIMVLEKLTPDQKALLKIDQDKLASH